MSVLKKRRDMPVDQVCEDSFYSNLLLGLPKTLASLGVEHTKIRRYPSRTSYDIFHWEQVNGVKLPADLKDFYCSCDGFLYFWALTDPEHEDVKVVSGKIQINPLEQLVRVTDYEAKTVIYKDQQELVLGLDSRVFALEPVDNNGNVVLLYKKTRHTPTIWFCSRNYDFHFLADDFTTYMRMAIAHLGILQWQMAHVGLRTTEASSELFRLHLPHSGSAKAPETEEEKGVVNTVDSDYMLNMKVHFMVPDKQELCSSPTTVNNVVTKKMNKNSPRLIKHKSHRTKKVHTK